MSRSLLAPCADPGETRPDETRHAHAPGAVCLSGRGTPIEDGCLTIERGRIAWVGPSSERTGDLDLGNVAIVPGFVNAHTHLELEPLESAAPAGTKKARFPGSGA